MGRIHLLPPEEARKIAAGEVVDRPAALVREFIDNAIDSEPALVEVSIEAGGTRRVEVSDDGCGMERGDLELACLTHATSKIRALDDLLQSKTMGFRGEALAAAAAVSRLEILTSTDGIEGWRLGTGPAGQDGGAVRIEAARRVRGTTVRALGLFDAIPARKRFLKRDGSEALVCRQIFIEKALAFPGLAFRFLQDGALKLFFPALSSNSIYKDRFAQAVLQNKGETAFLHEINVSGDGFSAVIVVGGPEIFREHRREQFVFANGRRINDYGLQQALEYGVQGAFPNGCHPCGAVFINVDPALADFNVHPAKREVKFADSAAIHHAITSALRIFFHNLLVGMVVKGSKTETAGEITREFQEFERQGTALPENESQAVFGEGGNESNWITFSPYAAPSRHEGVLPEFPRQPLSFATNNESRVPSLRYIGSAFNLFLLVEKDGRLYAVDQHAAHERILYNKLLSKPIVRQELLVPIPFTTGDAGDDAFLDAQKETLGHLGIGLAGGHGSWRIEALPALWRAGDAETVKALLDLRNAGENIAERWAATLACHGALRDGDILDDQSALNLAAEAFALPIHRCPHGRPFITEIKKEELLRAVRRL